jgi:hypothetical protein
LSGSIAEFCFSNEKMGVCFRASAVSSRRFFDEWSVGLFDEALWGLLDLLDEIHLEFGEADYRRGLIVHMTKS